MKGHHGGDFRKIKTKKRFHKFQISKKEKKNQNTYKNPGITMTLDFLTATLETRRYWSNALKSLWENDFHPTKPNYQICEGVIKIFSDTQYLKNFPFSESFRKLCSTKMRFTKNKRRPGTQETEIQLVRGNGDAQEGGTQKF